MCEVLLSLSYTCRNWGLERLSSHCWEAEGMGFEPRYEQETLICLNSVIFPKGLCITLSLGAAHVDVIAPVGWPTVTVAWEWGVSQDVRLSLRLGKSWENQAEFITLED